MSKIKKPVLIAFIILFVIVAVIFLYRYQGREQASGILFQLSEKPVETYFPMQPGNFWSYRGVGSEFADFTEQVLFRNEQLVQLKRANQGTTMVLIYEIDVNSITLVFSAEEFYEETNLLTQHKENRREIILKKPFHVGASWISGDRTYTIVDTNATVSTPAGIFMHCLKIHSTFEAGEHEIFQYYAPGVGMVKSEFRSGVSTIQSDLAKYNIR